MVRVEYKNGYYFDNIYIYTDFKFIKQFYIYLVDAFICWVK